MDSTVLSQSKPDLYRAITQKIVEAIEQGAEAWRMPWHRTGPLMRRPVNALTGNPYRGINAVALWVEAEAKRYSHGQWASYRQWQTLGAQVRGGEKAAVIVFYKERPLQLDDDGTGEPRLVRRLIARTSRVFNAAQVTGWRPAPEGQGGARPVIGNAARFVIATGADVRNGYDRACYRPVSDWIEVPHPRQFAHADPRLAIEGYYAVLLHELTHWTGHPRRLARDFGRRFGDAAYAVEELVAELGAAFLCADLEITNEPRPDHAAYVSSWLDVLSRDSRAIFLAASQAQAAVQYLNALQEGERETA